MNSIYGRLPVSGHYLQKRLRFAGLARGLAAFAIALMVAAVVFYRLGWIVPQALIGLLLLVGGRAAHRGTQGRECISTPLCRRGVR